MKALVIFYDASCPLCVKEMRKLRDYLSQAQFINIFDTQAMRAYPQLSLAALKQALHVFDAQGQLRQGVDANLYLWEQSGKKAYLQWLRKPWLYPLASLGYKLFARHRYFFSRLISGKSRCRHCQL